MYVQSYTFCIRNDMLIGFPVLLPSVCLSSAWLGVLMIRKSFQEYKHLPCKKSILILFYVTQQLNKVITFELTGKKTAGRAVCNDFFKIFFFLFLFKKIIIF